MSQNPRTGLTRPAVQPCGFLASAVFLIFSSLAHATDPQPRVGAAMAYDPVAQRVLMYGGTTDENGHENQRVYSLSMGPSPTWTTLTLSAAPGAYFSEKIFNQAVVHDSRRHRLVFYGGGLFTSYPGIVDIVSVINNLSVLQLSLADPSVGKWLKVSQDGAPRKDPDNNAGRILTTAVYDSLRDRIIIFGGLSGFSVDDDVAVGDCWEGRVVADDEATGHVTYQWTQIVGAGTPPGPRFGHGAFIDRRHDRMIVLGGYPDPQNPYTMMKVWSLNLSGAPVWTQHSTYSHSPPVGMMFGSGYDAGWGRYVLFGGIQGFTSQFGVVNPCDIIPLGYENRMWALWTYEDPWWLAWGWETPGTYAGGVRGDFALATAWASSNDAIASAGGARKQRCIGVPCFDLSVLAINSAGVMAVPDVGIPSSWSTVQVGYPMPPCPPSEPPGGGGGGGEIEPASGLGIAVAREGRFFRMSIRVPGDGEIKVDMLDVQGRLVRELAGGYWPAGTHRLSWDGRDESGGTVQPGVYFARLRAGGGEKSIRVAVY